MRRYRDNVLEDTPQSLGSWWAGVRTNDDVMDLQGIEWLLDGKIHFAMKGKHKVLQVSSEHHAETVVLAVGRAVYGCRRVHANVCLVEREFNANQAICMELTNMADGGEAISEWVVNRG